MRKFLLLFAVLTATLSNAQTVTQYFQSDKHFDIDGKSYYFCFTKESNPRMLVPLYPAQDCNNYYLVLTKNKAGNFVDILEKYLKKLDKWQKTANSEKVTNMTKSLGEIYYHGMKWPKYEFAYTINNTLYTVEYTVLTGTTGIVPNWLLEIDNNGLCYISIESILPPQKFTNNEAIESFDNTGGASISKKTVKITPGGKIMLNKEQLQWYVDTILDLAQQLDESKKENKKSKLFK